MARSGQLHTSEAYGQIMAFDNSKDLPVAAVLAILTKHVLAVKFKRKLSVFQLQTVIVNVIILRQGESLT